MKNKGFTLAEIMIALTVIGVITSIILPVVLQTVPDENVMKFKKGNAVLAKVINELVSSGEHYTVGDLGVKPDGELINGTHNGDNEYLCQTFAGVLNIKKINCSNAKTVTNGPSNWISYVDVGIVDNGSYDDTFESAAIKVDESCKIRQEAVGAEIVTNSNIIYFSANPLALYGQTWDENDVVALNKHCAEQNPDYASLCNLRFWKGLHKDIYGNERLYRTFCMDIDGINKGEEPFGYGIRADGKILLGKRAQEWLNKSIQEK